MKRNIGAERKDFIDVRMPFLPGKKLGDAYNEAMRTVTGWVVFVDNDVLLGVCRYWHKALLPAMKHAEKDNVGIITCKTNLIGTPEQKCEDAPGGFKILDHFRFAEARWIRYGAQRRYTRAPLSGFFLAIHKKVWEDVGGFESSWNCDYPFTLKAAELRWQMQLLEGVYVLHLREKKDQWSKS